MVLVGRGGVEPPTFHFSGGRSYQLSYLPERCQTLPEVHAKARTALARRQLCCLGSPAPIV